jgi:phosphoribosylanthranilate isomerase
MPELSRRYVPAYYSSSVNRYNKPIYSRPMLPFEIKICGVTNLDDARSVCRSGADAMGLNFFERSPRFLDEQTADVVVKAIDSHNAQVEQSGADIAPVQGQIAGVCVKKIGVFVNATVPRMVETAKKLRLDAIQLHGDESPSIVTVIRTALENDAVSCLLIRALRTNPASLDANRSSNETVRVANEIMDWTQAGIDAILLDAAMPGEFGGTGKVVDWTSIPELNCQVPLVLAGGLDPGNVRRGISVSGVQSVDVASGVESEPGIKDPEKIQAFVDAARSELDSRI